MSNSPASLTQLAKSILANAQIIEDFLSSNNLPQPSFDVKGPKDFPVGTEHAEIHVARHALIDATRELRNLIIGPVDTLKWMTMNDHTIAASLHAVYHFKIAQAVPVTGSISFADLAKLTGLSELNVTRFIHRAAIHHIFIEPSPGQVSHTAASMLLATDPNMQALLGHMAEEAFPASAKIVDALAMSAWSEGDGSAYMRDCYDWATLPKGATIVDVGGAEGHISLALAQKFTDLQFIVEDQPPVTNQAQDLIASFEQSVSQRVKFIPRDFFQPHPAEAIAMEKDSRLLIADAVLPSTGVLPNCQEEVLRSFDVSMLAQLNSQERTLEMWEELVKDSSDGKLGISKVIMPPKGESVSIIEITFK
ncbi:hypothetical protein B7463_g3998, partial [Scytalidium lignicola]